MYDADGFTRRSIPGLKPPERPPAVDKTFSITSRRAPPPTSQVRNMISKPWESQARNGYLWQAENILRISLQYVATGCHFRPGKRGAALLAGRKDVCTRAVFCSRPLVNRCLPHPPGMGEIQTLVVAFPHPTGPRRSSSQNSPYLLALLQNPAAMSALCNSPGRLNGDGGGGTGSISTMGAWLPWDGGGSSVLSEDAPGFLRMYIR